MKTLNANELKEHFRNHMNVDVVEIGDQAYACTRWNGEELKLRTKKKTLELAKCLILKKMKQLLKLLRLSLRCYNGRTDNQCVCKLQEMQEN